MQAIFALLAAVFLAHIGREGGGAFGAAEWTQLQYPGSVITPGNSVYENHVIGICTTEDNSTPQGCVTLVPEPAGGMLLATAAGLLLVRRRRKS